MSRPASGLDVMLILESVTPPFITRPFVIGLPARRKEKVLFTFKIAQELRFLSIPLSKSCTFALRFLALLILRSFVQKSRREGESDQNERRSEYSTDYDVYTDVLVTLIRP